MDCDDGLMLNTLVTAQYCDIVDFQLDSYNIIVQILVKVMSMPDCKCSQINFDNAKFVDCRHVLYNFVLYQEMNLTISVTRIQL